MKEIIKQPVKEILTDDNFQQQKSGNLFSSAIGKYVIVRTRNEGINFGLLMYANENGCVLNEARRIYYHRPNDNALSWYEGVAQSGLSESSKISNEVTKIIVEDYSITICSKEAVNNIREKKTNEQS